MSATDYIILAILTITMSKVVDYLVATNKAKWSYSEFKKICLVIISALLSASAICLFLGFAECTIYQTVNSKVVVDIYFEPLYITKPNKVLRIDNLGLVDVNDIHIYFTLYTFDSACIDKSGHFSLRKNYVKSFSTFGQMKDGVIKNRVIKSKDSAVFFLNNFVAMDTVFPPPDSLKFNLKFYSIRLSFRNEQNGELFIKYILTPANTQTPNYLENYIIMNHSFSFESGPVDSLIEIVKI